MPGRSQHCTPTAGADTIGVRGHGIGSRLLALTAKAVVERQTGSGLYLWVLEQNVAAQAFYQDRGGRCVERGHVLPPGGDFSRLNGSPAKLRYAWPHPAQLLD